MNIRSILIALGIVCIPMQVHAAQRTSWDFSRDFTSQQWMTNANIQMTQTAGGIRFQTSLEEAAIRKELDIDHAVDVMYVTYTSPKTFEMKVAWIPSGDTTGDTYMSPVSFGKSETPNTSGIDLTVYDEWHHNPKSIGLVFLPGTDVTISTVEVVGYNIFEKMFEVVKGFWQFDVFRPSSINFIWGPRLSFNPVATEKMYLSPPPVTYSANRLFYVIAAVGLLGLWWMKRTKKWMKQKAMFLSAILIGSIWVLYDIRMGTEFVSYLQHDYKTYYSKPVGIRTFRERLFFNDFANVIAPIVADRSEYIFMAQYQWPYNGLMRYITYPNSPTHPYDGNANRLDTWIVYRRPDLKLSADGRLTLGGQTISPPGAILHEFDTGTFIFRSTP